MHLDDDGGVEMFITERGVSTFFEASKEGTHAVYQRRLAIPWPVNLPEIQVRGRCAVLAICRVRHRQNVLA